MGKNKKTQAYIAPIKFWIPKCWLAMERSLPSVVEGVEWTVRNRWGSLQIVDDTNQNDMRDLRGKKPWSCQQEIRVYWEMERTDE